MTIDSHVHFWTFDAVRDSWITDDMKILRRNFLPEHLSILLKENEMAGCVAVQADRSETETDFLARLSETNPFIKGVVGWVDLQDEHIGQRLEYFSRFPVIKGWRHIVQAEPDDFLAGNKFKRGIRALAAFNYTYDLLVYHHQLRHALEFVSGFPEQRFVIDHCAKPDIRNNKIDDWKMYMKEMASFPNLYCKLSGLLTEAKWKEWKEADLYPYLDTVFELFGTDRLLFGSDWPVLQLSGSYGQWKDLLVRYMEKYSEADRQKIFGLNAIKFYNL
ncbi:MAG: amidohydrolase family protein [Ferruginibacter sp.]|nr:amidohydrolase family protein [Ferruginibacter sp.]